MSHLVFASDAESLAARLLDEIAAHRKKADPFEPITIVVPNRFVQQWLKFRIAREWGVAINLNFSFLEHALWEWLGELDPRPHATPPELLDGERYQLLVLSILWNDADPALAPLQAFFEKGTGGFSGSSSRLSSRRAWQLAGRLGTLIRDYEYHRQTPIIQQWLNPHGQVDVPQDWRETEAGQRAVFRAVVDEAHGRRTILNRSLGRNFKTLPQYVMEFLHEVKERREPRRRFIHLFGLSQMSPLHLRALETLGPFHEWRLYHFNPLVSRVAGGVTRIGLAKLANEYRGEARPDAKAGTELLHIWGRAAAESLHLAAGFMKQLQVRTSMLPDARKSSRPTTVLGRLQSSILGVDDSEPRPTPQDTSLQIVGCPGVWREVETIHAGILNALQKNPQLKQTDVAVLVSDMDVYRPAFTAVFERPPKRLAYALADYSAAGASAFGAAALGMLDLALENLSRTRVFEVLLNPCVLARLKIERDKALHWLTWAERLGIYHGWDAAEKKEQGYFASPLYTWKLGLRKLRLGQFMHARQGDPSAAAAQWDGVIPFADVESGDRERLDQFCRVVEGMLPMLVRLRGMQGTASDWADAILKLMQRFLAVPDDRQEEEPVRDALIVSLEKLREWDRLGGAVEASEQEAGDGAKARSAKLLPLALIREFVASHLREIPGRRSEFLSSGVTIAALQPQRPIPFDVIFLAGMGEKLFPGGAAPSSFDLRQIRRQPGDILPLEQHQFAFLEAILSAKQKLVITYNSKDLQKDESLQPAIPVAQLRRFVSKHILREAEFQIVKAPLLSHDRSFIEENAFPKYQDVLVQDREVDRLLSLEAVQGPALELSPLEAAMLERRRQAYRPTFGVAPDKAQLAAVPTLRLRHLQSFLGNPADAALKHHLHAGDEWSPDDMDEDHEPLASPKRIGRRLIEQTLQDLVRRGETENLDTLVATWPESFGERYREGSLRGNLPEEAFGEVDAGALREEIESALNAGGLRAFLETRRAKMCVGPWLIGESETPVGARRRSPALMLPFTRTLPHAAEVRLTGQWPFAWQDEQSLDLLVFGGKKAIPGVLDFGFFEPLLFVVALAALGELGGRQVTLFVMRPEELAPIPLAGPLLDPAAARQYLAELATDSFDHGCADQLPFALLRTCHLAYSGPEDAALGESLLRDWREKEDDHDWGYNCGSVVDLQDFGFRVPDDLYAKVRRRLAPMASLLPAPDSEMAAGEEEDDA